MTGELTGAPGAMLSTLGPGVSASATGLAHAFLDRSPLIYLSDRHPGAMLDFATHQAFDHAAFLIPVVKGSVVVTADSASHWIAHAAQLALKEPRGPVHLDLPADVASDTLSHPRLESVRRNEGAIEFALLVPVFRRGRVASRGNSSTSKCFRLS